MRVFEQRESAVRAYGRVYPVVFDKASNARQRDEAGKEYIDFFAGAGVLNFGHNNERMTQAVIDYLQSNGVLHSLDMMTTVKRRFMEQFEKVILKPRDMEHKMQFTGPTGSNAVEAAMKLARRVTARQDIVAFTRGFHGMTLGSLAATANRYFRGAAGVPLNHVTHYPFGCNKPCMGCESGCGLENIEHMRSLYRDTSSGVTPPAAFLLETIQAEGGVNVASREWLQAVASMAKEVGALLIVDDIQVGMGRTGSFFSFDDMEIEPDIICLAKGLGGMGLPIAMNLNKPALDEYWSPGEHTGTFRGQSLSFVAGTEALSYFEDDTLMTQVSEKGQTISDALTPLEEAYEQVQIRGKGMIFGLDVTTGERAKAIVEGCFEAGLLIASCGTGGRVIKLIPPLTIPDSDLQAGLETLVTVTQKVMEETV
ncbi:MAG: aspartate aminotransferase family protein [Methylophaga sp.]